MRYLGKELPRRRDRHRPAHPGPVRRGGRWGGRGGGGAGPAGPATAELADALDADLEQRGAAELLADVELPLVGVLARMERAGIAADADHFGRHVRQPGRRGKAAEQAAYAVVGHEFNLGSPKQLQEVLFTELGLPKTKRIKTGYTTDSEALTSLLAQTGTRCWRTCCGTGTWPGSRASWTR